MSVTGAARRRRNAQAPQRAEQLSGVVQPITGRPVADDLGGPVTMCGEDADATGRERSVQRFEERNPARAIEMRKQGTDPDKIVRPL